MYTKLKNILRCYASRMGIKETASTFHISRNTVRKYVRMFLTCGKSTEQLLSLSEDHLRELPGKPRRYSCTGMTPDSFLYMLLSREWDYRSQAAVTRMTKNAAFRYKAYLEEIDYNVSRGLDRNQMERLSTLDFAKTGKNLFRTGPSGTGKSFLACALGHEACKKGIRTLYANASKLLGQLKVDKVKNNIEAEMKKIERPQLLILDDLFLVPLDPKERGILHEIVEERHERKSIIITSQYPHTCWYDMVGDQTVADAILDHIIHSAHTIEMTGESLRKLKAKKN